MKAGAVMDKNRTTAPDHLDHLAMYCAHRGPALCAACSASRIRTLENDKARLEREAQTLAVAQDRREGRIEQLENDNARLERERDRLQERCDKQTVQAVDSTEAVSAVYDQLNELGT